MLVFYQVVSWFMSGSCLNSTKKHNIVTVQLFQHHIRLRVVLPAAAANIKIICLSPMWALGPPKMFEAKMPEYTHGYWLDNALQLGLAICGVLYVCKLAILIFVHSILS